MPISSDTHLKYGINISQFHRQASQLTPSSRGSISILSAYLRARDLSVRGYRYKKMSSQTLEKGATNMDDDEMQKDLPLSSSYEDAMDALSSLITRQKRSDRTPVSGKYGKLDRMEMYLKILGLDEHIGGLKIIHVAGTKGKGSTCTFSEAILRHCGLRTGLFISPHLIDVRERFRVNGEEISKDNFLHYFWDCWNQLREKVTEDLPMPPLFQFLTVLAFKIFVHEKVDVAVIEVGVGGKQDSTNVIKDPVVCGITSLGMDHTETLGDTLGQIASHKAGIFKPRIPAFSVPQLSEAMNVLQERAQELMVPLVVAEPLEREKLQGTKLSLSGDHQFTNAGLAVSLCKCWLQNTGNWEKLSQNDNFEESDIPEPFLKGLSSAYLSGRAQIVPDTSLDLTNSSESSRCTSGDLVFYLDGAHSPESMEACAKWFSSAVSEGESSSFPCAKTENTREVFLDGSIAQGTYEVEDYKQVPKRILLFNCMEVRDPQILLPTLVSTCSASGTHFSKALFVPGMSTYNKVTSATSFIPVGTLAKDLSWQFNLQRVWEKIIHGKDLALDQYPTPENPDCLPPHDFLYEDVSRSDPADNYFASSAVMPSLPSAIRWLRDAVRNNPSLKLQVLVTGSLHLVGDVLKLIKK